MCGFAHDFITNYSIYDMFTTFDQMSNNGAQFYKCGHQCSQSTHSLNSRYINATQYADGVHARCDNYECIRIHEISKLTTFEAL